MTMRISANRIDVDDKVLEKPVIKDYGLTANGGASGTTVASGYHLDFDGNDYVTATGLLGSPSVVSLCAWVRLDTPDSGGCEIISLGDGATIRVDDGASGVIGFYHYSSGWNTTPTSVDIEGTGWHHICYVCDPASSVQYVYIDGVQQASSTYAQAISYTGLGSNTEIGRHGNSATTRDLDGAVDDVRVYGRALTATEASTLFQGGSISSTSLLAHWAMDDGSGNASDSSGNGYTGTVTGATWTSGSATASYTIDLTQGNVCNLTLDAQQTALTFSNPPATGTHGSLTLLLAQDSTGSRLVTWPAAVRWLSNTTPTLSTTANAVDMFTFTTIDGGTSWVGTQSGAF